MDYITNNEQVNETIHNSCSQWTQSVVDKVVAKINENSML